MLASDQSLGWGLFGLGRGLEAGQIVVVTGLLLIGNLLDLVKVNRREWVLFLSAAVFSLALKMVLNEYQ